MKRSLGLLLGCLVTLSLFSQRRDTISGGSIILVGQYKVALTDARRIPTQPKLEYPKIKAPELSFALDLNEEKVPNRISVPKAERMKKPRPTRYKNNYIKAGYGNFNTSTVDAFLTMPGKLGILGFDAHLLNTNPGNENVLREFNTGIWGKRIFKQGSLLAHFNYANDEYSFYGYDTEAQIVPQNISQNFSRFEGGIGFGSADRGRRKPHYQISTDFYHLQQRALDSISPMEIGLSAKGNYRFPVQKQVVNIELGYDLQDYQSVYDTFTRHFVNLAPTYRIEKKQWNLNLGFIATVVAQDAEDVEFKFFPRVDGEYIIEKNSLSAFGGFGGKLNKTSLLELRQMNPFISPNQDLSNRVTQFELEAGLKGKLGKNTGFVLRMQYERVNDMPLFVNDSNDMRWFINIRDDVQRISFNAELNHHFSEKFRVAFSGFYHNYQTLTQDQAWQLPNLELKLLSTYNIGDKILISGEAFMVGKRYGFVAYDQANTSIELKPFFDLSAGIEYRWKKQLSAFLKFRNMTAQQYTYWNNLPVNGFNAMFGVTLGF